MQREFGGYLPLELPHGQELYTGAGVLRLNCGRNAIVAALRDAGWATASGCCMSTTSALRRTTCWPRSSAAGRG